MLTFRRAAQWSRCASDASPLSDVSFLGQAVHSLHHADNFVNPGRHGEASVGRLQGLYILSRTSRLSGHILNCFSILTQTLLSPRHALRRTSTSTGQNLLKDGPRRHATCVQRDRSRRQKMRNCATYEPSKRQTRWLQSYKQRKRRSVVYGNGGSISGSSDSAGRTSNFHRFITFSERARSFQGLGQDGQAQGRVEANLEWLFKVRFLGSVLQELTTGKLLCDLLPHM